VKRSDLTGLVFGRLLVIGFSRSTLMGAKTPKKRVFWRCRCECGEETEVQTSNLNGRNVESCGCLARDRVRERNRTHGRSKTQIHHVWTQMRQRCENTNNPNYRNYGGRGIRVCDRWKGPGGFERFLADVGERPAGRAARRTPWTLDRINNDGDYEPGNVRWATDEQQAKNRRNPKLTTEAARLIKDLILVGADDHTIGAMFHVTPGHVSGIRHGRCYAYVA
jgi:hypothetical protein